MPTVRILLNGAPLVSGGGTGYSSLDWDVTASRYERGGAILQLRGLKERLDGNHDSHYWLEDFELRDGDRLQVEWLTSDPDATPARIETHEQAEEFRNSLTASLEAKEVPTEGAPLLRARAGLCVEVSGLKPEVMCVEGELHLVYCHGFWAQDRYAEQWNLRLATHPVRQKTSGVWHSVSRVVHVSVPV